MQPSVEAVSWRVTGPEIMETDRYISSANAPELIEDVRLCIESGARSMVLDCAPLTYLTAHGLRAFLKIAHMMQDAGGTVSAQGLKGQPRELFEACGADSLIPLDVDCREARLHAV